MWLKNKFFLSLNITLFLILLLVGCFRNDLKLPFAKVSFLENQEDIYIMQGYAALDSQDFQSAKEAFSKAYTLNKNKNYLKEILGILVAQHDLENAKKQAYEYLAKYPKDEEVRGALVGILTSKGELDEALKEAKRMLKLNKSAQIMKPSPLFISCVMILTMPHKP